MSVWRSKDGDVAIRDMDDRHLLNAIAWVERNADAMMMRAAFAADAGADAMNGDMASALLEQEAARLYRGEDVEIADFFPPYGDLVDEAERRGLL